MMAWFLSALLLPSTLLAQPAKDAFEPIDPPAWVHGVTRMAFATPGELDKVAKAGAQVLHTNMVWPYYPLRRDGGGLSKKEHEQLKAFITDCHRKGIKIVLGLPPFMPVELAKKQTNWRERRAKDEKLREPIEKDLGTRSGCNLGPWGAYFTEVCGELVEDYGLDGFSFDGNYHPSICHCETCSLAYRLTGGPIPDKADLKYVEYRKYLVWRGERLEQHYRQLIARIRKASPDAALMTWTVNAGRYGHFLHSPRAMPTSLNRIIDLPMQEWWLDETNLGSSVAPAFGAAYLKAVAPGRPVAAEPYLMSRGNPYGTDSFPHHERLVRTMLALTHGNVAAHSLGWPGHSETTKDIFTEVAQREAWIKNAEPIRWAGMLVSEQTRQFYAYENIADRFLPHVFGPFRAALEEHLPLTLLNDWDMNEETLSKFKVVILPNSAALSNAQVAAIKKFVESGGGLVVTGETSLFDEVGQPRHDFALADVIGVHYKGRPKAAEKRAELDPNFAITVDDNYWKQRTGVARLTWKEHPIVQDATLQKLVPMSSVTLRGPLVWVSEPMEEEIAFRMTPEGWDKTPIPGGIARRFGKGKVVYLASGVDAALWSYAYPYQRRLFARCMEWAASISPTIEVKAPLCVQATFFQQKARKGTHAIVHLFNNVNTSAGHGLPSAEVPLREETIPIAGIKVLFHRNVPRRVTAQPSNTSLEIRRKEGLAWVEVPALPIHLMIVAEME